MFLNNLEDFSLAMRIYSIAGQAVTQGTATNISPLCFISCFEFISICEGAHRENSFPFYKSKLTYRKYLVNMVVESHSGFFSHDYCHYCLNLLLSTSDHYNSPVQMVGGEGRGVWRAGSCGGMEGGGQSSPSDYKGETIINWLSTRRESFDYYKALQGGGENRVNFIVTTNPPPLTPPLGDK